MKQCSICKKPSASFGPDSRSRDGFQSACRPCLRIKDAARRKKESERRNARQKQYWADLPAAEKAKRNRQGTLGVYGVSIAQFDQLLQKQKGVCALCKSPPSGKKTSHLQIDHDHKTGRIRGLLCNECNTALGRLGDDVKGLSRALKYLMR